MRSAAAIAILASVLAAHAATAQTPKRGGELRAAITAETDTTDCHAGVSFTTVHHLAPHYSFLLKHDQDRFPTIKGDLAESWTVSADGRVYTFRLRDGVVFHDGTPLTSADIKASYDRIRNPPQGVNSIRRANLAPIASVETPDPRTVVFQLSAPDAAMLTEFASPWNCIYSAAKLAADPLYPAKEVMGSGPFVFASRTPGDHWAGKRFDRYFQAGMPYLDGFRLIYMTGPAIPNALQGGAIDAEFRFLTPAQRNRLVETMGNRVTVQEAPLSSAIVLAFNTEKPPFNDPRVRKALSMAIDRRGVVESMKRVTNTNMIGGFLPPGSAFAATARELEAYPGFGNSADANRAEARRLLAEAGVSNLSFKLLNRNAQDPWATLGIFVLDQWRRIGLQIEQNAVDVPTHVNLTTSGNFDVTLDSHSDYIDEPSLLLAKFLSADRAPPPRNVARYTDRELDALYDRQRGEIDPAARRASLRALEARLFAQSYYTPLFWGERLTLHSSAVKGWKALPSHFLNQSLAEVWLDR
jgi:peptide/nickel transport system substrate-binding protein